jgi:hypothetical protein
MDSRQVGSEKQKQTFSSAHIAMFRPVASRAESRGRAFLSSRSNYRVRCGVRRSDSRRSNQQSLKGFATTTQSTDTPDQLQGLLEASLSSHAPLSSKALATWIDTLSPSQRARLSEQFSRPSSPPPAAAASTAADTPEPSFEQLRLVALNTAIPFVGFGIMDNSILIVAGDAIDTSLGVLLGISTMCAAAIGNSTFTQF